MKENPWIKNFVWPSKQKIFAPDDIYFGVARAVALENKFAEDVNKGLPDKILNYLYRLPDILTNSIVKAQKENPERCKRELILIRQEACHWYFLQHIENDQCNMKLYELKQELKWFIDETERIYNSLRPKEIEKKVEIDLPKEKRNYLVMAFYYYYKQRAGEIEWFDNWTGGRETAYKKIVNEKLKNPPKSAWKQFQRIYTKIENEHPSNRWQLCDKENYHFLMDLLKKDSPLGLAKAKTELNKSIEEQTA